MSEPSEILAKARAALGDAPGFGLDDAGALPRSKGAYALVILLDTRVEVRPRGIELVLAPGDYVYAGSAYGPGGLRARVSRHFRRDKPLRWHVDPLTIAARQICAITVEDGSECEIVARLIRSGAFQPALTGFGSSDCRTCTTHLLAARTARDESLRDPIGGLDST